MKENKGEKHLFWDSDKVIHSDYYRLIRSENKIILFNASTLTYGVALDLQHNSSAQRGRTKQGESDGRTRRRRRSSQGLSLGNTYCCSEKRRRIRVLPGPREKPCGRWKTRNIASRCQWILGGGRGGRNPIFTFGEFRFFAVRPGRKVFLPLCLATAAGKLQRTSWLPNCRTSVQYCIALHCTAQRCSGRPTPRAYSLVPQLGGRSNSWSQASSPQGPATGPATRPAMRLATGTAVVKM